MIERPQDLERLMLDTSKGNTALEVYVFLEYERQPRWQDHDTLVNGVNRSHDLGGMLENWLARDEIWRDVRARLVTYSQERGRFGVDRLVGLADISMCFPCAICRWRLPKERFTLFKRREKSYRKSLRARWIER